MRKTGFWWRGRWPALAVAGLLLTAANPAAARQADTGRDEGALPPAAGRSLLSPDGRLQIQAVEAKEPVRIDGTFDDEVWERAEPVSGFVQAEPRDGEPATEATEMRVAYDVDNLYIAAYCRDSEPDGIVVNNIRRDFQEGDQDSFAVIIDTFSDRRNGYLFITNPEGARSDQQIAGEGRERNASWDAVWFVRTRRVADGWTIEMAIPFRSLRFDRGGTPSWGINFSRRIRRKNEIDYWSPVPRSYDVTRLSMAGNLVGLPAVDPGRNLRVKPYVLGSSVRETGAGGFDGKADVGVDLKYGVTSAMTLDVTLRPDFAQAEADQQQVNLTQFSQFYPEKRDFFLENSGIFYVGDAARNNRVHLNPRPDTDLLMFFSRRIGLTRGGVPIPILGGARMTGQASGLAIGVLNIQTREEGSIPANNYTVVRVRKNILANSDIGAIFMNREATGRANDFNRVYGVDSYLRLFGNLDWSAYFVKTASPDVTEGQNAVRTSLNWEGRFFHGKGGFMTIGERFNNEMGYYRRSGARKYFLDTGIRPRPKALQRRGIRELHPHVVHSYYTDLSGRMVGKSFHNGLTFFLNNGGYSQISFNQKSEVITGPLRLHPDATPLSPGQYDWDEFAYQVQSDPSRVLSASATVTWGDMWGGDQSSVSAGIDVRPHYKFSASLDLRRTRITYGDRPDRNFTAQLWTMRANYSFNTNMFVDSLVQYNHDYDQFNANVRFNFIHRPLSDLFIVFNEQRFMTEDAVPAGRGFVVKFTRMLAF